MAFLIGTDEAGYGPNFGPLVVTATVWDVPDHLLRHDLYQLLQCGVVNRLPAEDDQRVWIGDSKQLYKAGMGLTHLERGVLAVLSALDRKLPATWQQLLAAVDPHGLSDARRLPWYEAFDESLPIDLPRNSIELAASHFREALTKSQMGVRNIRSAIVFEDRFNGLLNACGNKSSALSSVTLNLVQSLIGDLEGPGLVRCDKHGGRNKYGPLLQERFPDSLIVVRHEGREESRYETGPSDRRIEFRFTAKGDRYLPSALASMVSKYLRELAMRGFNSFWRSHVTQLRPTAGYPVDARRFKKDIAQAQLELGISDEILWRAR